MDWVKLFTKYPDDLAIATADDAGEVMFTRGLAYCGRAGTGGFIPDSKLQDLARRPSRAKVIVRQLTRDTPLGEPGPWERVPGGYRIRNWAHYQESLDALATRRKNDRERKRRQRTTGQVTGQSRDLSADVTGTEKSKSKTAAAAAVDAAAAADEGLPTAIAILRDKLQAHTALQGLRFDGLTLDKQIQLEVLIAKHGDTRLVDTALRTLRTPPPVHVSAFLGTWAALPDPGQRLRVIETECDQHPGQPATRCSGCAADRLAGDR